MTLPIRLLSIVVAYSFVIATVAPGSAARELNRPIALRASSEDTSATDAGLKFRLSEAPGQPEAPRPNKIVNASVLSDAETEAVLNRLPPLKAEATDQTEFALRDRSLPPPQTGAIKMRIFPAADEVARRDQNVDGPLEVLRYSPEGDVPIAPNLSITFSQPMVAVTSQEEAAENVPVKLSPQPPGKWHWIGTKTLLFEPDGRFPMATRYSVEVPARTRSANGTPLSNTKAWTFATPPPSVKNFYPTKASVQKRDVIMFAEFDQRIDPNTILEKLRVAADGNQVATRLATREEIDSDENLKNLVKDAEQNRWVAFRAVDSHGQIQNALPSGANITVTLAAGARSLEGPVETKEPQNFPFMTFAPLRVSRNYCWYDASVTCIPQHTWQIEFNNPLDAETVNESLIQIEPAIEFPRVSTAGNILRIDGTKKPNTTYRVTVNKSLKDSFGQSLARDVTVEFKLGGEPARIGMLGQGFVVLDPRGPRELSLYSVNYQTVKVSLYAVTPEDWPTFQAYRQQLYQNQRKLNPVTLPGRLVSSQNLELKQSPNEMIETPIDLGPALTDGLGQAIVSVESITPTSDRLHNPLVTWVQSTQIGLDAFIDNDRLVGWTNSLTDGSPLSDVQLQLLPAKVSGVTDSVGVASLQLKPDAQAEKSLLVARRGNDVAFLPEDAASFWSSKGEWFRKPPIDELRWYVIDDRGLYRPGEEVRVKGWIRRVGKGIGGDVGPLNGAIKRINYVLNDGQNNEVMKGVVTPNAFGGFDFALKLPANMNLGDAQVKFAAEGALKGVEGKSWFHNLSVQEFRRPEFEVTANLETEGPLFVGDHAQLNAAAKYFAGGGLQNADVKWEVRSQPTTFTPPNRDEFTFGKWTPWWEGSSGDDDENNEDELAGHTDSQGNHRLRIDFDSVKPARPSAVIAEARVQDVNRQEWTARVNLLVHPADLYVGLKSEKTFVEQGEPLVVQSIVTDLDGRAVANRNVTMTAVRLEWKQIKGEWTETETNPQDCQLRSALDPAPCTFNPKEGGPYRITATIHDDRGRANETEMRLWVAGGQQMPHRGVDEEKVELIPDRKEYNAGDTAQILVRAPFFPAEAIMSLRRSGIVKTERFRIAGPSYTLRVPIDEAWTPNVHVQVDVVGSEARDAGNAGVSPATRTGAAALRPAFASGEISLSIPPFARRLKVVATPRADTLEPGGATVIDVEARDANGKTAANSEIAVWVVDESVLSLINYHLSDPLPFFYTPREIETADYHSRAQLSLRPTAQGTRENAFALDEMNSINASMTSTVNVTASEISELPINGRRLESLSYLAPGAVKDGQIRFVTKSGSSEPTIRLRENFGALATFAPALHTDRNGRAQVQVKLPDNLTRYRVLALAVAGSKQFGSGESTITARLPLMARPSAPRFLNFGDRFELPIVLQNQTEKEMTVDLAVRAVNAAVSGSRLQVSSSPETRRPETLNSKPETTATGRRVVVPANDRVEVRIPTLAVKAGTARFQIGAVSGNWSDAAEVELPVWTPATTEAFATYGEIDQGAIDQPVKAPANVFPQFGGLQIDTSSTQLQQLTDAVIYLTSYPYECSEQLASRVITIAALRDVLTAFKTKELPSKEAMEAGVTRDLKRLHAMQNDDGGFGFWQRGNESWPYLSIHVAHALARAKQKKFEVPQDLFESSQKYLREIESHIPASYSTDAQRAIIAYALYVRAQMGDADAARARKLIAEAGLEKLSLESVGWLLSVLAKNKDSQSEVAAIRHLLNNRVTETAGTAHFVCSYNDADYLVLNSDRRADGVILEALISDQPNTDLIPKIVRGLLAHRVKGRWENTQENVFILLALDRYFNTFERVTPDFVARAWLGQRFAGEQSFKGRSTDRNQLNVPMSYLASQSAAQNLLLSKDGPGRLYYRIGLNYAPADLNLKPADYGFTVERVYEGIDDPKDVAREADGSWRIKAGARVRVRLTLVATSRRYHVALVDPLPAGLEPLNPSLATTGTLPRDKEETGVGEIGSRSFGFGWWWWRPEWFEHQNLRDDRVEAFTSLLWEGVYKYSYVARATTPGEFIVPPTKVEEMYHPETFGRSKSDRVRVE